MVISEVLVSAMLEPLHVVEEAMRRILRDIAIESGMAVL